MEIWDRVFIHIENSNGTIIDPSRGTPEVTVTAMMTFTMTYLHYVHRLEGTLLHEASYMMYG